VTCTYCARADLQRSKILSVSLSARLGSQELKPEAEFFPPERNIQLEKNNIWRPEFLTSLNQKDWPVIKDFPGLVVDVVTKLQRRLD
jgi:hypothetical protein